MTEQNLLIVNEKGLHARASAKFVEVVEAFDATAEVSLNGVSTTGDSIMGLLMLAASKGTTITVRTEGAAAAELAKALAELVANRFGEDY
ncbi:MAG: HPr family phosphocarrier protein [Rhodobacteraceae bacterium]|nr:HPr family phosphocarrier protein [Paracoccaceae bacterium]